MCLSVRGHVTNICIHLPAFTNKQSQARKEAKIDQMESFFSDFSYNNKLHQIL